MNPNKPGFLPVNNYLSLPREPNAWLLQPMIPVGGAALIYGQEKVGKSAIAIQLAAALAGGYPDWLGFPVQRTGPVLYLQLDNPRSTWALRFERLMKEGLKITPNLLLGDRESIEHFPFDILQPEHKNWLKQTIAVRAPVAVFVDTLRESHSGDEDSSTSMRNVITNLVDAVGTKSALIIISHSRKPHPDADKDLMADHRGSSYVTGRMDAIMRLTKNRLYYGGRSIEEGNVKLQRLEVDGALMWAPAEADLEPAFQKVLADPSLPSLRAKSRVLAVQLGLSEEGALSKLRRYMLAQEKETSHDSTKPDLSRLSDDSYGEPAEILR